MSAKAIYVCCMLLMFAYESSAIHCYYCNSANNSACADLNAIEPEIRTRIIPVVNCDTAIPSPVAVNFFCRKIVQTIFHSHREAELRVTRGCGWVPHSRECYRADNSDHLETVCQCFEDHCNAGHTRQAPIGLLATAVVLVFTSYVFGGLTK